MYFHEADLPQAHSLYNSILKISNDSQGARVPLKSFSLNYKIIMFLSFFHDEVEWYTEMEYKPNCNTLEITRALICRVN